MPPAQAAAGGRAFSALVLLQVLTRAVNFLLGALLARSLGPRWYALANVQLQLVTSSALFLAKEGLRRACQRVYPGGGGTTLAHGVNLAWLAAPLTAISGLAVGLSWAHAQSGETGGDAPLVAPREHAITVWMICAAAVLEACAEPAWLVAQANGLIPRRVAAEGVALLIKAGVTAWLVLKWRERLGVAYAFGLAQLLYAGAYALLLVAATTTATAAAAIAASTAASTAAFTAASTAAGSSKASRASGASAIGQAWLLLLLLLPRRAAVESRGGTPVWLPASHRATCAQYCWQSVQKYLLTEGERLALVWLSPLTQQGVFALVSNLGSLVAELVLQPVEEVVFAHFSQHSAAARRAATAASTTSSTAHDGDGAAGALVDLPALARFHALIRGATLFGGVFLAFGPAYSWLLLRLLYGSAWSDSEAPTLLGAYCAHVCAMSINGVAEAFVTATASASELARLSRAMVGFALVYLLLAAGGLHVGGSVGLVIANCLNMAVRIAYALSYVRRSAAAAAVTSSSSAAAANAARSRLRLLLDTRVLLALCLSFAATNATGRWLGTPLSPPLHHLIHVGLGGVCLLGVGGVALKAEPELLIALRAARKGARDD